MSYISVAFKGIKTVTRGVTCGVTRRVTRAMAYVLPLSPIFNVGDDIFVIRDIQACLRHNNNYQQH